MSITVQYNASLSGLGAGYGLQEYFNYFELTFSQPYHAGTGGFSTADGSTPVVNGVTYYSAFADTQYASETASTSQTSAFIASATSSGGLDDLIYTFFGGTGTPPGPTHTLFGPLDVIQFGSGLQLNGGTGLWGFTGNTYLTVNGLNSVLNAGLSGGAPIPWASNNNDIHNIIYPLMGGAGGAGYVSGLEDAFNDYGITVIGTGNGESFTGYNAADVFKTEGGVDDIYNFDATQDSVHLKTSIYGFGTASAALGAVSYNGNGDAYITVGGNTVTLLGIDNTVTLTAANFGVY
jgi:hypothetical protein